jgi:HTH-type transcriptional regulator/antitoxin HigA
MLKPIKSEQEYENYLIKINILMQKPVEPGTPESGELEMLSVLVKEYERNNYDIPKPDPIEVISSE